MVGLWLIIIVLCRRFPFIVGIQTSDTTEMTMLFGIGTCIIGDNWDIAGGTRIERFIGCWVYCTGIHGIIISCIIITGWGDHGCFVVGN
jgi:hypothetical protein